MRVEVPEHQKRQLMFSATARDDSSLRYQHLNIRILHVVLESTIFTFVIYMYIGMIPESIVEVILVLIIIVKKLNSPNTKNGSRYVNCCS